MTQYAFKSTSDVTAKTAGSVDSLNYSNTISLGSSAATVLSKNPTVVMTATGTSPITYTFYKILFVINGTAYLSAPFNPANGTTYKNVSNDKLIIVSNTPNPQISVTDAS